MPYDTAEHPAFITYCAAFRGRDVASIRRLQELRAGLDDRAIWILDNLAGCGASAADIVGGDLLAAEKVEAGLGEVLDRIGGAG